MIKSKASKASALKALPKKLNKNNKSTLVKMKNQVKAAVKSKVKTLVKAMSAKPAKKAQTKAPVKATKSAKASASKSAATKVVSTKVGKANEKTKKAAAAKTAKTAPVAKTASASKTVKTDTKSTAKASKAEVVVAAAVLKKSASGKKGKALSAEALEKLCREGNCENVATTKGYCRLDYIKNWKKIKRKEMILKEGKLNQYIEELVGKYPDKYIEVIRQDLSSEVNFNKVIHDLELDESIDDLDYDGDSIDSLIGSISKDKEGFDDDDEF